MKLFRVLTCMLILFSVESVAHIKWAMIDKLPSAELSVLMSESMRPFFSQRVYEISNIWCNDGHVIDRATTHSNIISDDYKYVKIGLQCKIRPVVLSFDTPFKFKKAKLNKLNGQYLPERSEFTKISILVQPYDERIPKLSGKYIEIVPVQSNLYSVGKEVSFKIYKDGRNYNPESVLLFNQYGDLSNTVSVSPSGLVTFIPSTVGQYILQVDQLVQGGMHVDGVLPAFNHIYSSMVFRVEDRNI